MLLKGKASRGKLRERKTGYEGASHMATNGPSGPNHNLVCLWSSSGQVDYIGGHGLCSLDLGIG